MADQIQFAAQPPPWIPASGPEAARQPGPLAQFHGARPPAPAWFDAAIAHEPERSIVESGGAGIELLTWGERGRPGLILVHGNTAHADWWSFIAPLLADTFRVAAFSLSGMGGSDWREAYSFATFADEIYACALAAGLYENGHKPIYVGHSFGGSSVYYSARRHPERMKGAILVDHGALVAPPRSPEETARLAMARAAGDEAAANEGFRAPHMHRGPNRVYATLDDALARFRFMPPQTVANFYIADLIARRSLKRAPTPEGGEGWTWRFDPSLFARLDRSGMENLPETAGAPVVHICGDRSPVAKRLREGTAGAGAGAVPFFMVPDSDHHIMLDQPLALVAALRGVLATWDPA